MKKRFLLIALMVLTILLCGCQYKKNQTYIVSSSNSTIQLQPELSWGTNRYYKKLMMGDKSIEFMGVEYTGHYSHSKDSIRYSSTIDYYETDSKDSVIVFGLRSDNGKFAYISFKNKTFYSEQKQLDDIVNSQDYAIEMSKELANQFLTDPESYELIIDDPQVMSYMEIYQINFIRRIGEYLSSDRMQVQISSKGTLCSVFVGDIGDYKDFIPSKVEKSDIHLIVESKIRKSLGNLDLKEIIVENDEMVKLPSGEYCVFSSVRVEYSEKDKNGATIDFADGITTVTVIDK